MSAGRSRVSRPFLSILPENAARWYLSCWSGWPVAWPLLRRLRPPTISPQRRLRRLLWRPVASARLGPRPRLRPLFALWRLRVLRLVLVRWSVPDHHGENTTHGMALRRQAAHQARRGPLWRCVLFRLQRGSASRTRGVARGRRGRRLRRDRHTARRAGVSPGRILCLLRLRSSGLLSSLRLRSGPGLRARLPEPLSCHSAAGGGLYFQDGGSLLLDSHAF